MKKLIFAVLILSLLVLPGCGAITGGEEPAQGAAGEWSTITAGEAYERIQSGDPVAIVDVRTAEEYEESHVPGAVLIPNDSIKEEKPEMLPLFDTEILVYCRSGNRSAAAAEKLAKLGYTDVSDFGGIVDWTYETETGKWTEPAEKKQTLSSFYAFDLSGVPVDESIFQGYELTMINIWATFCDPCIREMPELGKLNSDYSEKGVQVIGIVADIIKTKDGFDTYYVDRARDLVEKTGAAYTHLMPSADLVAAKLEKVNAVPYTIFVDSSGEIVGEAYAGARSYKSWAEIIEETVAVMN